jgi:asparagine synthase (glutamine-hydrolysing)
LSLITAASPNEPLARPTSGLLWVWDRSSSPAPQPGDLSSPLLPKRGVSCLWCAGWIANRAALIHQCGLPAGTPDRELLAHLYRRHGRRAVAHIEGSFAWILWDGEREELLAARDRLGSRGLYYAVFENSALVADGVEPLLQALPGRRVLNRTSAIGHLHGQAPLPGETFYEGVRAVEPGGLLSITRETVAVAHYWRLEPRPTLRLTSDEEYAEALRELLSHTAGEYVSSARLGVTLSGGMDSTSVAAAVRAAAPGVDLTAFGWITPELPEADESRYIAAVCGHMDLPFAPVRADLHWPLRSPGIQTTADTPLCFPYAGLWDATFREMQRCQVPIAFTGVSGDHLFGGDVFAYPDLLLTGRWLELGRQLREHLPHSPGGLARLLRLMVLGPIVRAYLPAWRNSSAVPEPWLGEECRSLYRAAFGRPEAPRAMLPGRLQRLRFWKMERMAQFLERSSAQAAEHAIELRHPLLDRRLIEFALSLPATQTFRAGERKIILRRAMRGLLPDEVLDKRGKITPEAIFCRGLIDREQAAAWSLLTDMRAAELGLVDEEGLRQTYQEYIDGMHRNTRFWNALTLEDWLRRHF